MSSKEVKYVSQNLERFITFSLDSSLWKGQSRVGSVHCRSRSFRPSWKKRNGRSSFIFTSISIISVLVQSTTKSCTFSWTHIIGWSFSQKMTSIGEKNRENERIFRSVSQLLKGMWRTALSFGPKKKNAVPFLPFVNVNGTNFRTKKYLKYKYFANYW